VSDRNTFDISYFDIRRLRLTFHCVVYCAFINTVDCDECRAAFVAEESGDDYLSQFTTTRSYGGLTHPSSELFCAAKIAESVFCANKPTLQRMTEAVNNITHQIIDVLETLEFDFPNCHSGIDHIMKKFVRLRVNEYASSQTRKYVTKRQYGSKTACRNTLIL